MSNLPMLPVLIPMLTGIIMMFTRKKVMLHRWLSMVSSLLMLVASLGLFLRIRESGMLVFCAGGWSAPFGIVFAMDLFSAIMVILSAVLSFTGLLFSFRTIDRECESHDYYLLWQFLMMGINGTFITGDIFNMFVFFEIMLMASYVILVIGSSKEQLRETFKYLLINILSSTVFLIALGVLYAMIGSMNMADIAYKLSILPQAGYISLLAMVFLGVFATKAAMFPFYIWLPQVHTVAASAVSSIFSGLLIKVGVYAMMRVYTLMFIGQPELTHSCLAVLAVITMLLGGIGAVGQSNFKRILAYSSISQVGYMIAGIGLFSVSSIAASIFYIFHHGITKGCLFLTAGITEKITHTKDLNKMGGLLSSYPLLGWTFFIMAMSMAGVPPLSGFFGKFTIGSAAAGQHNYWMLAFSLAAGFLTLFYMTKIFIRAFWGTAPQEYKPYAGFNYIQSMAPCLILMAVSILLGIFAEPAMQICQEAASQMMEPDYYIDTVLNVQGGK